MSTIPRLGASITAGKSGLLTSAKEQMRVRSGSRVFRIVVSLGRALAIGTLILGAMFRFGPVANTQSEGAIQKPKSPRPQFIPGELLVRFRSETDAEREQKQGGKLQIQGREAHISIERLEAADILEGLRFVRVDADDTLKAIAVFSARSDVLYAEPNYVRYPLATPNDEYYKFMWNLHNIGFLNGYPTGTQGADIHAEQAWDITTGSRDVVVGVVDGGIDIHHPDLQPNIWTNPAELSSNGLDDDNNGYVDDLNGFDFFHNQGSVLFDPSTTSTQNHATHVAGIIGAVGNNGIGVVGVNWQVSLMSLKIFGRDGESPYPSSVQVLVRAYVYAKKMRDLWTSSGGTKGANIRVLNNSIGGYGRSQAELDAVRALNDSGILFVAAAGNDTRNNDVFPVYPAGYEVANVISVAASDVTDKLAFFSNVGSRTVTLSAPGDAYSTASNSNYMGMSGTSMASPLVAGAAALICASSPNVSVSQLKAALIYNGDFIPSQAYKTLTGRRLNAFKALQAVAENDATPPAAFSDFRIVSQNGRSLTLAWTASGDDAKAGTASLYDIRFSATDPGTPAQFDAATGISPLAIPSPAVAGTMETATVDVPLQQTNGFIGLRVTDNMGNTSPVAVVPVSVDANIANQYEVTESAPQALSTGGTKVQFFLSPDDSYSYDYQLPFAFPFFSRQLTRVTVSTNGVLYFSPPPKFLLPPVTNSGASLDAFSSIRALQTNMMIAGMWDDLLVTGAIYAVTPDPNRIIFRWEASTFDIPFDDGTSRGQGPANFEIELDRDGTIQIRYGDGNQKLFPVVGISAGGPDAYLVQSHTSENAFLNLANANTVRFSPRIAPAPTSADLEVVLNDVTVGIPRDGGGNWNVALQGGVAPGQTIQYKATVTDLGPDAADNVVFTSQLPAGTTFVECEDINAPCLGPPPGTDGGTVTLNFGTLGNIFHRKSAEARIRVRVNAPAGTMLVNNISVSSSTPDLNPGNSMIAVTTPVVDFSSFGEVKAIYGNNGNTIALRLDGTVWFWALPFGGNGSPEDSIMTPKRVLGLSNIVAIATSTNHALALRSDGTVWTWGVNELGQLGNQPISTAVVYPPTQIPGLNNIQSIATAPQSSFAAAADGTVWSWGDNSLGQLGDGTTTGHSIPVPLSTISGVRSVAANLNCTYAVKQDGTVWSWGSNKFGVLGTGNIDSNAVSLVPVQVAGLANMQLVATEDYHAVALQSDGTAWTWGLGEGGEIGNGSRTDSAVPVHVPGFTGALTVDAGASACMVLKTDGTVWMWGESQLTPAQVGGLAGIKGVGVWGQTHAVIMADDTLQMWGTYNGFGALGDFTFTKRTTRGPVKFLSILAAPTFDPDGNRYVFSQDVTIDCDTPGASIHYTTNGADPTENDPIIAAAQTIRIDHSAVVKARAWKSGSWPSVVSSRAYTIEATGNLIDEPWSFVRQHYLDFLSREADQGGLDYWNGQITQCGIDQTCIRHKRIGVSNAFFYELEYQQTAAYVFRMYRAAFGNSQPFPNPDAANPALSPSLQAQAKKVPNFAAFSPDRALLIGSANLAQDQLALASAFAQRPEFLNKYPSSLTGPQYVDTLLANIKSDSGADLTPQRDALVAQYDQGGRGMVLYRVADDNVQTNPINNRTFIDAEYNLAFVASQYFGYLRRDSDIDGFLFWLGQVGGAPLRDLPKQQAMVCSFITSAEYQQRFGSVVTHSNGECSP